MFVFSGRLCNVCDMTLQIAHIKINAVKLGRIALFVPEVLDISKLSQSIDWLQNRDRKLSLLFQNYS